jgi:hypothetical protein
VDEKECVVKMPSGPTKFRTTAVKPFYVEEGQQEAEPLQDLPESPPPPVRTRPVVLIPFKSREELEKPAETYDVFLTRKEQADLDLSRELRAAGKITAPGEPFEESMQKEIDSLIARGVFEFVRYDPDKHRGRVFNSRMVNEVKGKTTLTPYEKTRLVIQAYNDAGKGEILTQSPTI